MLARFETSVPYSCCPGLYTTNLPGLKQVFLIVVALACCGKLGSIPIQVFLIVVATTMWYTSKFETSVPYSCCPGYVTLGMLGGLKQVFLIVVALACMWYTSKFETSVPYSCCPGLFVVCLFETSVPYRATTIRNTCFKLIVAYPNKPGQLV